MKLTITQLRKIQKAGEQARNDIYEREQAALAIKHRKLIGKCFKYRNSCGTDEKWWLYRKIVAVEDGEPVSFEFEIVANGHLEIRGDQRAWLSEEWTEISDGEFRDAWIGHSQKLAGWLERAGIAP